MFAKPNILIPELYPVTIITNNTLFTIKLENKTMFICKCWGDTPQYIKYNRNVLCGIQILWYEEHYGCRVRVVCEDSNLEH